MTSRWGVVAAECHVDRDDASATLATEAALIAGRWAAPCVHGELPQSIGSWPLELLTTLEPPTAHQLQARAKERGELEPEPEPLGLADLESTTDSIPAKKPLDWSECSLHNLMSFDADLALPPAVFKERFREKAALKVGQESLAMMDISRAKEKEAMGMGMDNGTNHSGGGIGGVSMIDLPADVLGGGPRNGNGNESESESGFISLSENDRLAAQHALVSAPWKDCKFWRDSGKEEMVARKQKQQRKWSNNRDCFDQHCIRNPNATNPWLQKIQDMNAKGLSRQSQGPGSLKATPIPAHQEMIEESHVAEAFGLIRTVGSALADSDAEGGEGGRLGGMVGLGLGFGGDVTPAVLFRAMDGDNSGQLDEDELMDAFTRLGLGLQVIAH